MVAYRISLSVRGKRWATICGRDDARTLGLPLAVTTDRGYRERVRSAGQSCLSLPIK